MLDQPKKSRSPRFTETLKIRPTEKTPPTGSEVTYYLPRSRLFL